MSPFVKIFSLYGVLALAALPLVFGLVPPNQWYGFRLPGTLEDPELWYQINAIGGRNFVFAMLVGAAANLLIWWKGTQALLHYLVWINVAIILLSVWIVTLELVDHLP